VTLQVGRKAAETALDQSVDRDPVHQVNSRSVVDAYNQLCRKENIAAKLNTSFKHETKRNEHR